jgi:hypothetical protein
MESCASSLSWDGLLCECCRDIFDSHVGDWRSRRLASETLNRDRERHLWHDINTMKQCATQRCRFCYLALANLNKNNEFEDFCNEIASRETRLAAHIMDPHEDGCHIYILYARENPQTINDKPLRYDSLPIPVDITIQGIGTFLVFQRD